MTGETEKDLWQAYGVARSRLGIFWLEVFPSDVHLEHRELLAC